MLAYVILEGKGGGDFLMFFSLLIIILEGGILCLIVEAWESTSLTIRIKSNAFLISMYYLKCTA